MKTKKHLLLPLLTLLLTGCATSRPGSSSAQKGSASDGEATSANSSPQKEDSSSEEGQLIKVTLSSTNGALTNSDFSSKEKTNSAGKTAGGSVFPVVYQYGRASSGKYGSFQKSTGLLRNGEPIKGLKSIKITYSSAAKASYCFSSSSSPKTFQTLESGKTYEANGETYFFFQSGKRIVEIASIEVIFTGVEKEIEWDTNYSSDNVSKADMSKAKTKITDVDDCDSALGTQNILVLPIEFTDYPFSDSEIEDIKTLCAGEASDTKYWESLASYYEKSSYGKLDLQFTFADPYNVDMTAKEYYNVATASTSYSNYEYGAARALKESVKAYKKANGTDSTKKFDEDGDGYIDSAIMIYSAPESPSYDYYNFYWAFRYWDIWDDNLGGVNDGPTPNLNSPTGYSYFWASLNFFYDGVSGGKGHGVDAHTLIHEFGHMLGADDYYNAGANSSGEIGYEPSGCNVMMAYNIADHDAFNKLQYGWVDPSYVQGSCEVTLSSFEKTGDCVLIADDDGWNGTAFDEYLLLELYTPTGLNELDSKSKYNGGYAQAQSQPGIRLWHVDNRLYKTNSYNKAAGWASDEEVSSGDFGNYFPSIAISNSDSEYYSQADGKGYEALTLVSPKGTKYTSTSSSTNQDLFHQGDRFSLLDADLIDTYAPYFGGNASFDNGNPFNYEIEVTSLSSDSATLRFTKAKA